MSMCDLADEIPSTDTLLSWKRPALQKLCKRVGLKANGKNTTMITNLEIMRRSRSDVDPEVKREEPVSPRVVVPRKDSSPELWVTPPTSPQPKPVPARKGNRGRKRKGRKMGVKSAPQPPPSLSPSFQVTPPRGRKEDLKCKPQLLSPHFQAKSKSPSPLPPKLQATPPSERPSRKRKRKETYSPSPSEASLCIPHSAKQLKLDPDTAAPRWQELGVAVGDMVCATPTQQEPRVMSDGQEDRPPFSPPSSTEMKSASNQRPRRRNSTFVVSSNNSSIAGAEGSGRNTPNERSPVPSLKRKRNLTYEKDGGSSMLSDGAEVDLQVEEPPLTKRSRRSTYEVPSHESSLVNISGVASGLDESGLMMMAAVGGCDESGGDSGGDLDVKEELLNMLDQRVEERKADPKYNPVFTIPNSASRIPVKSATAKKFDKAHKKQFRKMQSITSCYQAQMARKRHTNTIASGKKPKKQSLTSLARESIRRSLSDSAKKARAKVRNPSSSSSSGSQFTPSVTTAKGAKFNFSASTAVTTAEKTVSFGGSALRPQNCQRAESKTAQRPRTPWKTRPSTSSSAVKTPSKTLTSENKNNSRKFDLQASLKKPKPKYKTYSGKVSVRGTGKNP